MKHRLSILLLLLALLLPGCAQQPTEETPTPEPTLSATVTTMPSQTPQPTPAPTPTPIPLSEIPDETLVNVRDYIPSVFVDLRYATENNFTGQVIYDFTAAQLRCGTVKKLALAADALAAQGYALLIWDAYRPVSAQFRLWEVWPDSTYVANPNTGYSNHSRGSCVDISLVTTDGGAVEMPSGFDEFTLRADRDYSDVSGEAAMHARLLEQAMTDAGFVPYAGEWWHYTDSVRYEVVQ